jgi:signal transduction histidine kinase
MSRVPITLRLTLAFAAAMAVVLAVTGLFLHSQLGQALDRTIDEGLRSRADDISTLANRAGRELGAREQDRLTGADDSFAQIWAADGRLIAATHEVGARRLLTDAERARALRGVVEVERRLIPNFEEEEVRLLATPVRPGTRAPVVVVGSSLEDRDGALDRLRTLLLVGGPVALALSCLVGYALARAALRPVAVMRRRAAIISADEPGSRLPLPVADDEVADLGRTFNGVLDRLEQALERERRFVSEASHELRTPLAILRAELELALEEGGSLEEVQEALRSAAEETDRLVQLAQDLLIIASASEGRLPVRAADAEVHDVFEGVVERFRRRAEERGRELIVDAPGGIAVCADRLRLDQALGNMVENALRHGDGSVRLLARESEGHVELHVLDAGPGFPPDFIARAFGRFCRADDAHGPGGSGLGLSVVEAIAAAHGGIARAMNRGEGGADVLGLAPPQGDDGGPLGRHPGRRGVRLGLAPYGSGRDNRRADRGPRPGPP